jgi:hypothetical protein
MGTHHLQSFQSVWRPQHTLINRPTVKHTSQYANINQPRKPVAARYIRPINYQYNNRFPGR